jgi:hypothetical protein
MGVSRATTRYNVMLNTTERPGQPAWMTFDLISSGNLGDSLEVLAFAHDGRARPISMPGLTYFEGGPVDGDLYLGQNPAARTVMGNQFFFNTLSVPFDSLGSFVAFAVQLPEPSPAPGGIPDQAAFFYFADSVTAVFVTTDPLGTNALFAIDVTGQAGGDLSVFAPMQFVPPDTLRMTNSTVAVPPGEHLEARLRFRSVAPNPSPGGVAFTYDVPEPGGRLRIKVFDVAGRLVAEPFHGKRGPGTWTTRWDAADAGGRSMPAGVYIVQLQMAGQSLVRRVVIAR